MRGHFGSIFKATEDTSQWPLCDLGGEKKTRATMRMVMVMAMCGFMRG
jgi:hypothetical protein